MPLANPSRRSIQGASAVRAALDAGEPVRLVLLGRDPSDEERALAERATCAGATLWVGSEGDLRRMSRGAPATLLAQLGPPRPETLPALMATPGVVWMLAGAAMPSNVGFAIRTAEVSGAAGLVVDAAFSRAERSRAQHVSMGAHRILPVFWEPADATIEAARGAGRQVIAVEDVGDAAPWELELARDPLLVLGAERDGVPAPVLAKADATLRLPMGGFVPSYNLQAAMSMVAAEVLRQQALLES